MSSYNKNNPESIKNMFGSIAKQYDRTNAIMSFQLHRYWNSQLITKTLYSKQPQSYLDLCCGTGEISLNYLKKTKNNCEAYLLDFCPEMLYHAKLRAEKLTLPHAISYLQADAQAIPLADATMDCATMAYGIRNIPNPYLSFQEIYRVLKPEGRVGVLELTQPSHAVLRKGHAFYLEKILPLIGRMVTSNQQAYEYLCNSIKSFVKPEDLEKMLLNIGFKNTQVSPLMGGIATIITAEK